MPSLSYRRNGVDNDYLLGEQDVVVGRAESADICVPEPNVSRRHLVIKKVSKGYEVQDLSSSHGTDINGHRVRKRLLKDGDRVTIGLGFTLTFYAVP